MRKLLSDIKAAASKIFWIGWYSFMEAVRNRLFLALVVLSAPLAISAWLVDSYELGFQIRVIKDSGIVISSVVGLLVVLFFSLDLIIPDLEHRTVYFILTRSPGRQTYVMGRFLGMSMTLAVFHGFMSSVLMIVLRVSHGAWFYEIATGGLILFMKQALLVSTILLLAVFSTKIVVVSLGVLLYVLGHGIDIFRMMLDRKQDSVFPVLLDIVSLVLPDFSLYETRFLVMSEIPAQGQALMLLFLYTLCISFFYLSLSGYILSRRDL